MHIYIPSVSLRNTKKSYKRAGGGSSSSSSSSGKGSSGSGSSSASSSGKGSSSSSGGKGSSGSTPSKGSSSSAGSSLTGTKGSTASTSSTIYGSSRSITPYSNGVTKIITIPSGQLFAGRSAGGATRDQIYGTKTYGSGYPGVSGRGVASRGFPFFFWPVVWGGVAGGSASYLYDENEYGSPDNSSRPGGKLLTAAFQSNSTSSIFRIISDNTTVVNLISDIHANCSSHLTPNSASSSSSAVLYNSSAPDAPKPEQVVQYFRSSTVALTLDGYNNTAVFDSEGTADVPLPSGVDTTLLDCMNSTIGAAVPLVDAGSIRWGTSSYGIVGLLWVLMYLVNIF
ncbi:hypothetical protein C8R41DRAFT_821308 [Lentinula lateritia]|uniref:Uncharacterized protein n=1 Tax=Lentinula lateritia TaxID=40482 RepID=A0ABQ8VN63_9AGAR|nr:hypothetical protein C8R41DRAFT_821308 [Lentinula lateritia]